MITNKELAFIGECFIRDINIEHRLDKTKNNEKDVSRLVQLFTSHAKSRSVVYTAFDGDHFHVLQNMRKFVLEKKCFPANPESILGYKNIVTRYQNKYGVLMDDLAILQSCDELWIFTDYPTSVQGVLNLPEGVLVELTFYLKRHSSPSVNFISIRDLLRNGKAEKRKLMFSFEDIESALLKAKRPEVTKMANSNFKVDKDLKNLVYFISDPLDYKYAEWLREDRATNIDEIALVPGLASWISDANYGMSNIGNIVLSWATLLHKISKKRAYTLESIDSRRNQSIICEALKKYCVQIKGAKYIESKKWSSYSIPKSMQREKWPITKYEANMLIK